MKWIKCSERLPVINQRVLIYDGYITLAKYSEIYPDTNPGFIIFVDNNYYTYPDVTHWAELSIPEDK